MEDVCEILENRKGSNWWQGSVSCKERGLRDEMALLRVVDTEGGGKGKGVHQAFPSF